LKEISEEEDPLENRGVDGKKKRGRMPKGSLYEVWRAGVRNGSSWRKKRGAKKWCLER
jgi:hypothetical protein